MWTILEALNWTQDYLAKHGEQNPRLTAQLLLEYATKLERIELYINYDKPLTETERASLRESIKRRVSGEPLQYIIGKAPFRHLEIKVRLGVLIPRPETEVLVDLVLDYLSKKDQEKRPEPLGLSGDNAAQWRILDLCTGTGCIALSLLDEQPNCHLTAIDIDPVAIELAQLNSTEHGLDDAASLEILPGDLASELLLESKNHASFDVVVANPPYIPSALLTQLPQEVSGYEPCLALDGGEDGLELFRRITEQATILLKPGGLLACELHEDCLEIAAAKIDKSLYSEIKIHLDLTGRTRFITAIKSSGKAVESSV